MYATQYMLTAKAGIVLNLWLMYALSLEKNKCK